MPLPEGVPQLPRRRPRTAERLGPTPGGSSLLSLRGGSVDPIEGRRAPARPLDLLLPEVPSSFLRPRSAGAAPRRASRRHPFIAGGRGSTSPPLPSLGVRAAPPLPARLPSAAGQEPARGRRRTPNPAVPSALSAPRRAGIRGNQARGRRGGGGAASPRLGPARGARGERCHRDSIGGHRARIVPEAGALPRASGGGGEEKSVRSVD